MTVIHESFIGTAGHPRYFTVIELPLGVLRREKRLIDRICAGECSYEFIREIAESTLPFQNIANLLDNVIALNEWTTRNCNLKSMCQQILKACNKAADHTKHPLTGYHLREGDWDNTGRGLKRYPHTYEVILRPHMRAVYEKRRDRKDDDAWAHRTRLDGSPGVMEQRVEDAREGKPRTYWGPYKPRERSEEVRAQ